MVVPLRRNQSDSSESKIGSRCGPADGTVTWPSACSLEPGPAAPFVAVPALPALGPSLPWMFWLPTGNCGPCGGGWTAPPKAGILLRPPAAAAGGSVSSR
jgi:hypothetical protein